MNQVVAAGREPGTGGPPRPLRVTVLAGGVGAARFLSGLVEAQPFVDLAVVGNTGDDFVVHGLHVSPDLDSVTYTLCGVGDEARGWGIRDESWQALDQLRRLGEESWFQLGDRDLGTHIFRTARLRDGLPLSAVTKALGERLGLPLRLLPMTDDEVVTRIQTHDGRDLHIQEYLVREACQPRISAVEYRGCGRARPAPGVLEAIEGAEVVILAPSNPLISIGPILAVPGIREAVAKAPSVLAVSPIVGGRAIKGPAVEMMQAAGLPASPVGIADYYRGLLDILVVDAIDAALADEVRARGVTPQICDTMMVSKAARRRLANFVLAAARSHLTCATG